MHSQVALQPNAQILQFKTSTDDRLETIGIKRRDCMLKDRFVSHVERLLCLRNATFDLGFGLLGRASLSRLAIQFVVVDILLREPNIFDIQPRHVR